MRILIVLLQAMFVLTPSHEESEVEQTVEVFMDICGVYTQAIDLGKVDGLSIKPVSRHIV